jgi:hypothetical protein
MIYSLTAMFLRLATLFIALSVWQCNTQPIPTYKESIIQFNNQLRPQLLGSWQFKQTQVELRKLGWSGNDTGIARDTVLQNLATLSFEPFTGKVYDERLLDLDGSIRFRGRDYPVQVKIYPTRDVSTTKGVMWVALKYDPQINYISEDVKFMESIGLVGVNFNFNTEFGQPVMVLRTIDKGIALAILGKDK